MAPWCTQRGFYARSALYKRIYILNKGRGGGQLNRKTIIGFCINKRTQMKETLDMLVRKKRKLHGGQTKRRKFVRCFWSYKWRIVNDDGLLTRINEMHTSSSTTPASSWENESFYKSFRVHRRLFTCSFMYIFFLVLPKAHMYLSSQPEKLMVFLAFAIFFFFGDG